MTKEEFIKKWNVLAMESFKNDIESTIQQAIADHEQKAWSRDIDLAYLMGVFNVVGLDGLGIEIERLKKIGKQPHDIFDAFRELPKAYQEGTI